MQSQMIDVQYRGRDGRALEAAILDPSAELKYSNALVPMRAHVAAGITAGLTFGDCKIARLEPRHFALALIEAEEE